MALVHKFEKLVNGEALHPRFERHPARPLRMPGSLRSRASTSVLSRRWRGERLETTS